MHVSHGFALLIAIAVCKWKSTTGFRTPLVWTLDQLRNRVLFTLFLQSFFKKPSMNAEADEGPRRSTSTNQGVPEPRLDPLNPV